MSVSVKDVERVRALRRVRVPAGWPPVVAVAWGLAVVAQATGQVSLAGHEAVLGRGAVRASAVLLFMVAWQAHVVAMMLPSSLPMMRLFARAAAGQPHQVVVRGAFLGGYLAVWGAFGAAALGADAVVHRAVERAPWLEARPELLLAGALLTGGAFQFSHLKARCLRACRMPGSFLRRHYRRGSAAAFALGARHGAFCVGCCWALMLVVFAAGLANVLLMAPLAVVMTVEKTVRGGERLVVPVGVGLLAAGALVAARGLG